MKIAALLLLGASCAALAAETPPPPGIPKDFRVPDKVESSLANGLDLTLIEWGSVPKTTIVAILRAGNLDEGEQTWLADLTGEMLKEGAGTHSAAEIAETAARMGGGVAVGVGPDQTTVSIDVLSEFAPQALALIADLLRRPQLPAAELERIKRNFERNLALSRTQPDALANEAFFALLYPDHPYGRVYPTESQLAAYTLEDVQRFWRENFGAARTHLYIAGQFDRVAIEAAVGESFGDWAAGPAPLARPPVPVKKAQVKLIDRPGAPQSTMLLGLPVPDPSAPDFLIAALMNSLLGGEFTSRITTNIRETKGYAYSPRSTIGARYRTAYWVEQADVTTEATGPALKEIFHEIERLKHEPPSPAELKGMQNYRAGLFTIRNSDRGALIGQLAYMNLHGLPDEYLTHYVEHVYAITPEQVSAAARTLILPEDMTLVIVGDLKKIRPQLEHVPQLKGLLPGA
ncbi:MAG TPA: pitrilysin family protein [Steroidobacteraceae bacterium]|nr:pitrilysin family protein [Steroidobacteraceae bacterium]